jgi:hypothetical protein
MKASMEKEIAIRLKDISESFQIIENQEKELDKLINDKIVKILSEKLSVLEPPITVESFKEENKEGIESLKKTLYNKYVSYFDEKKRVLNSLRDQLMIYHGV